MKTFLIKTIVLSFFMIIGYCFSLKAQDLDSIGRPKMGNIALFLVDYNNYELIGGSHKIFPCKGCPEGGLIYNVRHTSYGDMMLHELILTEFRFVIASFFVHSFELGDDSSTSPFFFPNNDKNNTYHPFKFNEDSFSYNNLPDSFIRDLHLREEESINETRISERLDSTWAVVSSSRIARKFIELPNYQVIFKYIRYNSTSKKSREFLGLDSTYPERWLVILYYADITSSIDDIQESEIQIFPNPTTNLTQVNITGLNPNELTVLQLVNLTGQIIQTQNFNSSSIQTQFDLSNLPHGLYSIKVSNESVVTTIKLIKL